MQIPTVIWHTPTPVTESGRLLFTAHKLVTGQYQYYSWLTLPSLPLHPPTNLIVFPNLPYTEIPKFWLRTSRQVKQVTPAIAPIKLVNDLAHLLEQTWDSQTYDTMITKLRTSWEDIASEFWTDLSLIIPRSQDIHYLHIYPTLYGTSKSFSLLSRNQHIINIYLRLDQTTTALIDGIVSSIIRGDLQSKCHFTWTETESAKDAILLSTSLKKYCADHISTLHATRTLQKGQFTDLSQAYLTQLCINTTYPIIS